MGSQTIVVSAIWEIFPVPESEHPQQQLVLLGQALRSLREEQGLTIDELATASAVHRQRIHALETGYLDPTYELLLALADALGVQPSALIIRAEELKTASEP